MSLNWNAEKVKNYNSMIETPIGKALLEALTSALGFSVGINSITKENWKKVFVRIDIGQRMSGAWFFTYNDKMEKIPYYITPQDVVNWIGLETNGCTFTIGEFAKRLEKNLMSNLKI